MTIILKEMLGDIVECYVNDLVVKSCQRRDHLKHSRLYLIGAITPVGSEPTKKCAFRVRSGKFLGFIV